jgi:Flp pilus assembly protein TadG
MLRPLARLVRRAQRRAADEKGANILEMAFIAMFLFTFTAGIVDLGGAFQHYIVVINASREGARTYARLPCLSGNRATLRTAIVNSAVGEAARSGVTLLSKNVIMTPDPASTCPANGQQITVTVKDDFTTLMGAFWNMTKFTIVADTDMMFFGTDE